MTLRADQEKLMATELVVPTHRNTAWVLLIDVQITLIPPFATLVTIAEMSPMAGVAVKATGNVIVTAGDINNVP